MAQEPPSSSPPGDEHGDADRPERADDPVLGTLRATRSFSVLDETELGSTGFFKPLPATDRLERIWAAVGLNLGRRLSTVVRDDHIYLILMAAVVGVTSGAAAAVLLLWIDAALQLFPRPGEDAGLRSLVVILIPVLGGLLAGGIRLLISRVLKQPLAVGVPAVIEAVSNRGGELRGRAGLLAGVGTGISIGSGGAVGHEGPSVAIGATVGSVLARFFGLRQRRQVAMAGAGCAAGIAAAFNAPLAGVIFTVELVFGGAIGGAVGTMSMFIPLIVAAVAGTFTSHAIFGTRQEFAIEAHASAGLTDLGFYLLLAMAAGIIGATFSRIVIRTTRGFDRLPWPEWSKPALGGLVVGLLAVATQSNHVLGGGRGAVDAALHGTLGWELALILLGVKMVATAFTMGSGGFGGIFMPSLLVGTCLGTLVGMVAQLLPGAEVQAPGAYALVGMGAIFGALMHAPLTPIVMIFELTRDFGIILPLMLSCILATVVARRLGARSFYRAVLDQRGVVLRDEAEQAVMERGRVGSIMVDPPAVLTLGAGLEEIRSVALGTDLGAVFVVNDMGAVVGFVDGHQLSRRMLAGEIASESTAADLMGSRRLAYLVPGDTLAGAMLALARSDLNTLPVVDDERHLLGVVRRRDVLARYSDEVLGRQEMSLEIARSSDASHDEVGLGQGVVLERVVVTRRWAGRTLAALDMRGRTGAIVLEWRRGTALMPLDPNAPLREGDIVALAGTREAILRSRRL